MAKDVVDTRKLKDSAAELLKKGKLEKAVEVLEQLARHEPKDTSHRLRLGDAYRRIGDSAKAISWYQTAAKIFSDQDQLLKAIGANQSPGTGGRQRFPRTRISPKGRGEL